MGRWPELKTVKPQKLAIARTKSASCDAINKYYQELGTILTSNNLAINLAASTILMKLAFPKNTPIQGSFVI